MKGALNTELVAMFAIVRRSGRCVLWNGNCEQPAYHSLCETCGWLSPAARSVGAALDEPCEACAERSAGAARRAAFVEGVCQLLVRSGHEDGAWLGRTRICAGRRVH